MSTQIQITYTKNKKGSVGKKVKEIYLRDDIPCGLFNCNLCVTQSNTLNLEGDEKYIYILDEYTVLNQIDVIQNCPKLVNVVIMQTIVQNIKQKNVNTYNNLRNLVESEIYRKIHIFANEYSKDTYTQIQPNETQEQRNQRAIFNSVLWYQSHLKNGNNINVMFITNNYSQYIIAQQQGINTITIFDYLKQQAKEFPNLMDFMGLIENQNQEMDLEDQQGECLFEEHLNQSELIERVKSGDLFQGKMRIDRNNVNQGSIYINKLDIEIIVFEQKNLNRSLNGDIVVVEILPENQWVKQKYMQDLKELDENTKEDEIQQKIKIKNEEKYLNIIQKIKFLNLIPQGKVKGIIKRVQRFFCGQINNENIDQLNISNNIFIREFIPVDSRYPNFYIKTTNPQNLEDKRIQIVFDNWPKNSKYPFGHFKMLIGPSGDIHTEGDVILLEHGVEYRQFSKQVLDCLPQEGSNWKIPQSEFSKRVDLRHLKVCSIDPIGCKDIDDALHCIKLPSGNYEVGVHIADVSHFVKANSPIDKEAQNRCTTVYLVDRRTDMLPKLLTETLCSLKDDGERLSFSVVWEIDPEGNIIQTRYHKSVIHSVASLNYQQAQNMIDNKNDNTELTNSIRYLNLLAKKLKAKRIQNGALSLASTQVKFSFDDETHNPIDVSFYQMYDTNSLIEEFMLLANVSVAQKIIDHFPSISILRQHQQPKQKQIKELASILSKIGYNLDFSSNKNLAHSLDQINRDNDSFFNKLIRIMTTRAMNEAVYLCTADADYTDFYHYGLAAPLYTHFTSPIRRYADILVHRLLAAAIDLEGIPAFMSNKLKMSKICEKMNMRNRNARFASRASSDYNTYLFFKDKQVEEIGMVSSINQKGFIVIIPRYGLEGQIQFNEQDLDDNEKLLQELLQKEDLIIDFITNRNRHKLFDYIKVRISIGMKNFHKQIKLEYLGRTNK
ncbi:rnb family protein, putative [Ichthyophthirius multifiliis]|uniref:Rnb family protein, putative n=1 Tax=Ichthyophthirius multifiliis TaxID=5932 RepID=G0QMW6_ICHMU|nr:rnb family protein, putative [Ichthyophthirius multifiliis]EGR33437.1 rnb family protein, putative [Ichthyophthirius multifiliis]|eukprot:XP_004037423.1 rnb family protein, putative [Ichthyophthirius multifiliis]